MPPQNTQYIVPSQNSQNSHITPVPSPIPPISSFHAGAHAESSEILIRLKTIAINPADIKSIDQGHRVTSWPFVPGLDGAGIVEDVGNEVQRFGVGDEVVALFSPGDRAASFQDFAVVEERVVAKKPEEWSWEEGASLGTSYMTAVMALGIGLPAPLSFLKDGPTTGLHPSSVLILGGSSALGAATIQLLRLTLPQCTILTTSSPKHHRHLLTLGANQAFDRTSPSLTDEVKKARPKFKGVDAIIDTVGAGRSQRDIFETLDPSGPKRYAQVWTGDEEIQVPDGVESVMFRGRDVTRLQGGGNVMLALERLLEEGRYKLPLPVRPVGEGLDGLEKGLELMRVGVSGEKLVVGL